jgi:hypothetical protein
MALITSSSQLAKREKAKGINSTIPTEMFAVQSSIREQPRRVTDGPHFSGLDGCDDDILL